MYKMKVKNPLKDWHIFSPPKHDIYIKKGEEIEVPDIFEQTLITEGVIKPGEVKQTNKR